MNMTGLQAVVLATSSLQQADTMRIDVGTKLCGQEMLLYTTTLLESLAIPTAVVTDAQADHVQTLVSKHHAQKITCIPVMPQHTVEQVVAQAVNQADVKDVLVIDGCMPLLDTQTIVDLYTQHVQADTTLTCVLAHNQELSHEQEHADVCCIHPGLYIVQRSFLESFTHVRQELNAGVRLSCDALAQKAVIEQRTVITVPVAFDTVRQVCNFHELWAVEQIKRSEIIMHWMAHGVRFLAAHQVYVDVTASIGAGSCIGAGVHILGSTQIGTNCTIEAFSMLDQVILGNNSRVYAHSVIKKSTLGAQVQIGPFAHLQEKTLIGDHSIIGNFVEIKRTVVGSHTKAKHLAYLGDATLGNHVNIGAGTVTCNHDGFKKHATTIEDHAYIGTNTTLVAPLVVEQRAFVAAGSTITKQVPAHALAIARSRQINKLGYVHVLREKKNKVNENPTTAFIGAIKGESSDNTAV